MRWSNEHDHVGPAESEPGRVRPGPGDRTAKVRARPPGGLGDLRARGRPRPRERQPLRRYRRQPMRIGDRHVRPGTLSIGDANESTVHGLQADSDGDRSRRSSEASTLTDRGQQRARRRAGFDIFEDGVQGHRLLGRASGRQRRLHHDAERAADAPACCPRRQLPGHLVPRTSCWSSPSNVFVHETTGSGAVGPGEPHHRRGPDGGEGGTSSRSRTTTPTTTTVPHRVVRRHEDPEHRGSTTAARSRGRTRMATGGSIFTSGSPRGARGTTRRASLPASSAGSATERAGSSFEGGCPEATRLAAPDLSLTTCGNVRPAPSGPGAERTTTDTTTTRRREPMKFRNVRVATALAAVGLFIGLAGLIAPTALGARRELIQVHHAAG